MSFLDPTENIFEVLQLGLFILKVNMNNIETINYPKIIKHEIDNTLVNAVNARDLHEKLNIGKDFSTWVKDRLEDFDLENDYVVFPKIGEKGGRPLKEYILTLDTAKHISMVERNEIGKKIRQYFIDVEKQATKPVPKTLTEIVAYTAHKMVEFEQNQHHQQLEIEKTKTEVNEIKTEVDAVAKNIDTFAPILSSATQLVNSKGSMLVRNFATVWNTKNPNNSIGANKIYALLRHVGVLQKVKHSLNIPVQKYVKLGYFDVKGNKNGYKPTTYLTGKGQIWLMGQMEGFIQQVHDDYKNMIGD